MKIGELAKRSGCSVQTIRYYEKEGLIPSPLRSAGNFRIYSNQAHETLLFIKHCRSLDLTLKEIKQLMHIREAPDSGCEEVNAMVDAHLHQIESRMTELNQLHAALTALRASCADPRAVRECGILEGLASEPLNRR